MATCGGLTLLVILYEMQKGAVSAASSRISASFLASEDERWAHFERFLAWSEGSANRTQQRLARIMTILRRANFSAGGFTEEDVLEDEQLASRIGMPPHFLQPVRRERFGERLNGCPADYSNTRPPDWVAESLAPEREAEVARLLRNGFQELVVIGIVSTSADLQTRMKFIQSWAGNHLGKSVFLISDGHVDTPGFIHVDCDQTRQGLGCKTAALYDALWARFPNTEFFMRIMDDTFVHLSNLIRYCLWLAPDAHKYLTISARQIIDPENAGLRFGDDDGHLVSDTYPHSGSGWMHSRGFMARAVPRLNELRDLSTRQSGDDLAVGIWIQNMRLVVSKECAFEQHPAVVDQCPPQPKHCPPPGTGMFHPIVFHQHIDWGASPRSVDAMPALVEIFNFSAPMTLTPPYTLEMEDGPGHDRIWWRLCRCVRE
jgi:hypothetical protein